MERVEASRPAHEPDQFHWTANQTSSNHRDPAQALNTPAHPQRGLQTPQRTPAQILDNSGSSSLSSFEERMTTVSSSTLFYTLLSSSGGVSRFNNKTN